MLRAATLMQFGALPPGPGPFTQDVLQQPVPGAARALSPAGWQTGKLCDVSKPPYLAKNGTNATALLQKAIDDCGDLEGGGTALVPSGFLLQTASLFLRSNLTFRVEEGSTLLGTATGSGHNTDPSVLDAPIVYTRRNAIMTDAHAGLLNGAKCLRKKDTLVGWDDCAEWSKLQNVVIEGGGVLDANGVNWYKEWGHSKGNDYNKRPMMLDLLWIDGLTIRDMKIRRPGYWTVHPTFSNNVRITNNSIITDLTNKGTNTDGCDPDSSWNVYIAGNHFSTGDDCIAIKAGRDWSGRMVNISTQNVLAEQNVFEMGHGVSIGSETSGWVRNITIRDSVLNGTNLAVRIKSMRGRGGGVEDVLYENLSGQVIGGIQLTLNYNKADKTNASATPELRRITIRNVNVEASKSDLDCDGLAESVIDGITFENVTVTGKGSTKQDCSNCRILASSSNPLPECTPVTPTPAPAPTPKPAPTPPTPKPTKPTPTPPADCDPHKCLDRCVAKYGGSIADQRAAYFCGKGCAGLESGKIRDINKFCKDPASSREATCETYCNSASDIPTNIAECKYGCGYWSK